MSVPGVGSGAAEQITEDALTDKEAEINADEEADELENARNAKSDAEDVNDENASNNEERNSGKWIFSTPCIPSLELARYIGSPGERTKSTQILTQITRRGKVHSPMVYRKTSIHMVAEAPVVVHPRSKNLVLKQLKQLEQKLRHGLR